MATVEPHTPEPGYLWRWSKQAFLLMTRRPDALLLLAGGMLLGGIAAFISFSVLHFANAPASIQMSAIFTLPLLLCLPAIVGTTSMFFYADTGEGPSIADTWRVIKTAGKHAAVIVFVVNLIIALLLGIETESLSEDATISSLPYNMSSVGDALIIAGLVMGSAGVMGYIMYLAWSTMIIVPFLLGMGGTHRDAEVFDRKLRKIAPSVRHSIFIVCAVVAFICFNFKILWLPLFYYLLAFLYVAARELVGGIRENGTQLNTTIATTPSSL